MFQNARYLTRGVQSEIPIELQLFMWNCIKSVPEPNYLQIFWLESAGTSQKIPMSRNSLNTTRNICLKQIFRSLPRFMSLTAMTTAQYYLQTNTEITMPSFMDGNFIYGGF